MITARDKLFNYLNQLVKKEEVEKMIEEYEEEVFAQLYKVYKVESNSSYIGTSLVAARTADEANHYINIFREIDKNNESDSWGYCTVNEDDALENTWSSKSGILDYGIRYCG